MWLFGYVLGIILFPFVSAATIGWFITPVGVLVTILVLIKKVKTKALQDYLLISIIWTAIAIILDYLLLVQLFKPEDGYYKFDVYLYYVFTFTLPLVVGILKKQYH